MNKNRFIIFALSLLTVISYAIDEQALKKTFDEIQKRFIDPTTQEVLEKNEKTEKTLPDRIEEFFLHDDRGKVLVKIGMESKEGSSLSVISFKNDLEKAFQHKANQLKKDHRFYIAWGRTSKELAIISTLVALGACSSCIIGVVPPVPAFSVATAGAISSVGFYYWSSNCNKNEQLLAKHISEIQDAKNTIKYTFKIAESSHHHHHHGNQQN